jgi:hypothetical protein
MRRLERTRLSPQALPRYLHHSNRMRPAKRKNRTGIGPHPRPQNGQRFQRRNQAMSGGLRLAVHVRRELRRLLGRPVDVTYRDIWRQNECLRSARFDDINYLCQGDRVCVTPAHTGDLQRQSCQSPQSTLVVPPPIRPPGSPPPQPPQQPPNPLGCPLTGSCCVQVRQPIVLFNQWQKPRKALCVLSKGDNILVAITDQKQNNLLGQVRCTPVGVPDPKKVLLSGYIQIHDPAGGRNVSKGVSCNGP